MPLLIMQGMFTLGAEEPLVLGAMQRTLSSVSERMGS